MVPAVSASTVHTSAALRCELWRQRAVCKPLSPAPGSWLKYLNPRLSHTVRSSAPWWPVTFPLSGHAASKFTNALALQLDAHPEAAPQSYSQFEMGVALESGRAVVVDSCGLVDTRGKVYASLNLKGVGPIDEFCGSSNPINRWNRHGHTSTLQSYIDLARMNVLRHAGVDTPLGIAIFDLGRSYTEVDSQRRVVYQSALYVRAMRTPVRLFNLRECAPELLQQVLQFELPLLEQIYDVQLPTPESYLLWFAKRLGRQAARMQRLGYLHGALHAQQICLDGAVCDFEHEMGTGFLEAPAADFHYANPTFSFGRQPEHFASLVASDVYSESLWQILAVLDSAGYPSLDCALGCFWTEYEREHSSYQPPALRSMITEYGLDNSELIRELFGTELEQSKPKDANLMAIALG